MPLYTHGHTRRWLRGPSLPSPYCWPTRGCRPRPQHVGCPSVASEVGVVVRSWTRPRQSRSCRDGLMGRGGEEMVDDLDLAWEQDEPRRRRGAPPSRQQRRRRKDQRRRKGRSYGALIISTLLLIGLGAGVYWGVG